MKRIVFFSMVLCILLAMAACSDATENEETELTEAIETQEATEPAETTVTTEETQQPTVSNGELVTVFQGECPYEEQYEIWDISTEVFSQEILEQIGADGFTGTDAEIAQQIFDWQVNNMEYAGAENTYIDAGYPHRWNEILPGIYPASKRIERVTDDGKIYGICFDYAEIYCAIARAYGLECRVTVYTFEAFEEMYGCLPLAVVESELNRGMGRDEYEQLNVLLEENGIDLTYDQVYRAVSGISLLEGHVQGDHGRAEVYLDGEWVSMDVGHFLRPPANPEEDEAKQFTVKNWDGIYNP